MWKKITLSLMTTSVVALFANTTLADTIPKQEGEVPDSGGLNYEDWDDLVVE